MTTNTLCRKARLTVRRADHMGMCFGVRDAIAFAKREVAVAPLTVLGELVHNATVLRELSRSGVNFENQPEHVQTESVMITAHGTSDGARARAESSGLQLHDATCPLVHQAHRQLQAVVCNRHQRPRVRFVFLKPRPHRDTVDIYMPARKACACSGCSRGPR